MLPMFSRTTAVPNASKENRSFLGVGRRRLDIAFSLLTVVPVAMLFLLPRVPSLDFLPNGIALLLIAVLLLAAQIAALLLLPKLALTRRETVIGFVTWLFCFVPVALSLSLVLLCVLAGSACE